MKCSTMLGLEDGKKRKATGGLQESCSVIQDRGREGKSDTGENPGGIDRVGPDRRDSGAIDISFDLFNVGNVSADGQKGRLPVHDTYLGI